MIHKNTVFILGAGASKPFEFPTGAELKNQILQIDVERGKKVARLSNTHSDYNPIWKYIFSKLDESKVEKFFLDLGRSGKGSVDAFIEHRPEFTDIGKLFISYQLIRYENEKILFGKGGDWYQYLYDKLNTSFEDFPNNNVSFITFNYDRSLEHAFLTWLMSDYNVDKRTAAQALSSIDIIHLHGMIGVLPAISIQNSREYDQLTSELSLDIASKNIKIIHENISDSDENFIKAKELISNAELICFLGFGYGEKNLARLDFPHILKRPQQVLATTYGLKKGEIINIQSFFSGSLREETIDRTGRLDCLNYLRTHINYFN